MARENETAYEDGEESQSRTEGCIYIDVNSEVAKDDEEEAAYLLTNGKTIPASSDPEENLSEENLLYSRLKEGVDNRRLNRVYIVLFVLGIVAVIQAVLLVVCPITHGDQGTQSMRFNQMSTNSPFPPKISVNDSSTSRPDRPTHHTGAASQEIWIKAEYISSRSETIVWNRLSSNAGTKQIILSESNTEVQVPEGGYYYTLATLKIVGMNCKTTLNGRVSIRFCLLHNNDQVKCTDDSHPLSTADVWARTISLTVPYISMSSGDRLRFVTSNPGCIYDDGKVSVLEIHQIT